MKLTVLMRKVTFVSSLENVFNCSSCPFQDAAYQPPTDRDALLFLLVSADFLRGLKLTVI